MMLNIKMYVSDKYDVTQKINMLRTMREVHIEHTECKLKDRCPDVIFLDYLIDLLEEKVKKIEEQEEIVRTGEY